MNKHDFYKELMSEYTFDAEKIRTNAKKGRFAKQKISPMAIGLTAAVAACTVACGTLAISMVDSKGGIDLVDTGSQSLSALSSAERVKYAIEQQNKELNSEELHNVLVTFDVPISSAQAKAVIAEHTDENIPVKAVYLADGTRISGGDVADVFGGDGYSISALCIECEGSAMAQLQNAPEVFLVELLSQADFETAMPMKPEEMETVEAVIPDVKPDDVYDMPDTPEQTTPDNAVVVIPDEDEETAETTEGTTESPDAPAETTEIAETTEATDTTETTEPSQSTEIGGTAEAPAPDETVEPTEPSDVTDPVPDVTTEAVLPEGVTLPETLQPYKYETAPLGAKSAFFLTDDMLFVISDEVIALYSFNGGSELPVTSAECSSAAIHWVDDDGGRVLVSGVGENGMRNKLLLVDAYSREIFDLKAEDTVMEGTLAGVGYNEASEILLLNVKHYGDYYVTALHLSSTTADYINIIFDTKAKIELLSCYENTAYLAVTDASLTQIYAVDVNSGAKRIIKTYDSKPEISHNYALTHGLVMPADTAVTGRIEIFDPATETFISTGYFNESIIFGASKNSFYAAKETFVVAGGAIAPTSDITELAKIDWNKSFSSRYAATAGDVVTITESVYSKYNTSLPLVIGKVEPQCSTQLSEALNGAIGANNMLANGYCTQAGVKDMETLRKVLSLYYTEASVQQLVSMCEITDYGQLKYTNGGLKAISADKTVLVITSDDGAAAAGTLYVKIGKICGVTAYRTINLQFVLENGSWKLNTIIGE